MNKQAPYELEHTWEEALFNSMRYYIKQSVGTNIPNQFLYISSRTCSNSFTIPGLQSQFTDVPSKSINAV